jgi:hypothetical protein
MFHGVGDFDRQHHAGPVGHCVESATFPKCLPTVENAVDSRQLVNMKSFTLDPRNLNPKRFCNNCEFEASEIADAYPGLTITDATVYHATTCPGPGPGVYRSTETVNALYRSCCMTILTEYDPGEDAQTDWGAMKSSRS